MYKYTNIMNTDNYDQKLVVNRLDTRPTSPPKEKKQVHYPYRCTYHPHEKIKYFLTVRKKFICEQCIFSGDFTINKHNSVRVKNEDIIKQSQLIKDHLIEFRDYIDEKIKE